MRIGVGGGDGDIGAEAAQIATFAPTPTGHVLLALLLQVHSFLVIPLAHVPPGHPVAHDLHGTSSHVSAQH